MALSFNSTENIWQAAASGFVVLLEERVRRLVLQDEVDEALGRGVQRSAGEARLAPQLLHLHAHVRQLPLLGPATQGAGK